MLIEKNTSSAIVSDFLDQGYVVLHNVISKDLIEQIKNKINGLEPINWDDYYPCERYKCIFNRDQFWLQFIDHSRIYPIAKKILGDDCHIIGQTAWKTSPGYGGCPLHVDQLFLHEEGLKYNPFIFTAHFYLNDMIEELGPTYVIPKSHLANRYPDNDCYKGEKLQPVLCKAGDVLLFRSEIWHSGGSNATKECRYLLQVHYSRRMIAQKFHPYLEFQFNDDILKSCNTTQKRLLGDHMRAAYD